MPTDAVTLDTTHGLGTFAGGQNFTLSYNGLTTGDIDWTQDTAGQSNINSLQSKLNALSNIANSVSDSGALGVAVTRSNLNSATNNNEGYIFSVTFKGLNVKGNVPLLSLASNTLGGQVTTDGNISIVINEQREGYTPGNRLGYAGIIVPRQKIVSENLGGTFTLNFDTSGVPPNNEWKCRVCSIHENVFSGAINPLQSDQSQVDSLQYVLNEMTNIGLGNVAVSYTRTQNGRTTKENVLYKITFSGNKVNGDVPLLEVSSNAMSGDQYSTTVTEVYKGHEIKGQFKLSFAGETTLGINVGTCPMSTNPNNDYINNCLYSASLAERLEALSSVKRLTASRKDYNDGCGGYDYFITFSENEGDVPFLIPSDFNLYGTGSNPQGGLKTTVMKVTQSVSAVTAFPCSAGTYASDTETCVALGMAQELQCMNKCPSGRYGSVLGKVNMLEACPEQCSVGKYGNGTGGTSESTSCTVCPLGRFGDLAGQPSLATGCPYDGSNNLIDPLNVLNVTSMTDENNITVLIVYVNNYIHIVNNTCTSASTSSNLSSFTTATSAILENKTSNIISITTLNENCDKGNFITLLLNSNNSHYEQICKTCASGTYTKVANQLSCFKHKTCLPGQYISNKGDATSDNTCSSCTLNTFSSNENQQQCKYHTTCLPGFFVALKGNALHDNLCLPCGYGTFSNESNSTICNSWEVCKAPLFAMKSSGSNKNNRICYKCESGRHTASNNAAKCNTVIPNPYNSTQFNLSDCSPKGFKTISESLGWFIVAIFLLSFILVISVSLCIKCHGRNAHKHAIKHIRKAKTHMHKIKTKIIPKAAKIAPANENIISKQKLNEVVPASLVTRNMSAGKKNGTPFRQSSAGGKKGSPFRQKNVENKVSPLPPILKPDVENNMKPNKDEDASLIVPPPPPLLTPFVNKYFEVEKNNSVHSSSDSNEESNYSLSTSGESSSEDESSYNFSGIWGNQSNEVEHQQHNHQGHHHHHHHHHHRHHNRNHHLESLPPLNAGPSKQILHFQSSAHHASHELHKRMIAARALPILMIPQGIAQLEIAIKHACGNDKGQNLPEKYRENIENAKQFVENIRKKALDNICNAINNVPAMPRQYERLNQAVCKTEKKQRILYTILY